MEGKENKADRRLPFVCQMCSLCCTGEGGILMRPEEAEAAARELGMEVADFLDRHTRPRNGEVEVVTDGRGVCSLLGPQGCRIHAVKPRICRAWPFLPQILANPDAFEEAKLGCPGLDPEASHEDFLRQARQETNQKE